MRMLVLVSWVALCAMVLSGCKSPSLPCDVRMNAKVYDANQDGVPTRVEVSLGAITVSTPKFTPLISEPSSANALNFGDMKKPDTLLKLIQQSNMGASQVSYDSLSAGATAKTDLSTAPDAATTSELPSAVQEKLVSLLGPSANTYTLNAFDTIHLMAQLHSEMVNIEAFNNFDGIFDSNQFFSSDASWPSAGVWAPYRMQFTVTVNPGWYTDKRGYDAVIEIQIPELPLCNKGEQCEKGDPCCDRNAPPREVKFMAVVPQESEQTVTELTSAMNELKLAGKFSGTIQSIAIQGAINKVSALAKRLEGPCENVLHLVTYPTENTVRIHIRPTRVPNNDKAVIKPTNMLLTAYVLIKQDSKTDNDLTAPATHITTVELLRNNLASLQSDGCKIKVEFVTPESAEAKANAVKSALEYARAVASNLNEIEAEQELGIVTHDFMPDTMESAKKKVASLISKLESKPTTWTELGKEWADASEAVKKVLSEAKPRNTIEVLKETITSLQSDLDKIATPEQTEAKTESVKSAQRSVATIDSSLTEIKTKYADLAPAPTTAALKTAGRKIASLSSKLRSTPTTWTESDKAEATDTIKVLTELADVAQPPENKKTAAHPAALEPLKDTERSVVKAPRAATEPPKDTERSVVKAPSAAAEPPQNKETAEAMEDREDDDNTGKPGILNGLYFPNEIIVKYCGSFVKTAYNPKWFGLWPGGRDKRYGVTKDGKDNFRTLRTLLPKYMPFQRKPFGFVVEPTGFYEDTKDTDGKTIQRTCYISYSISNPPTRPDQQPQEVYYSTSYDATPKLLSELPSARFPNLDGILRLPTPTEEYGFYERIMLRIKRENARGEEEVQVRTIVLSPKAAAPPTGGGKGATVDINMNGLSGTKIPLSEITPSVAAIATKGNVQLTVKQIEEKKAGTP